MPACGFIPHAACSELATITSAVAERCAGQDEYLTDALSSLRSLLESCPDDHTIVVTIG